MSTQVQVNDRRWHHIVFTFDSREASWNIYLDGKLQNVNSRLPARRKTCNFKNKITIGCIIEHTGEPGRFFQGYLDDLRMYTRVLSPEEVLTLYSGETTPAGEETTPDDSDTNQLEHSCWFLVCFGAGCATVPIGNRAPFFVTEDIPLPPEVPLKQGLKELSERWKQDPIPIGLTRQTFYDDAILAKRTLSFERRLGKTTKLNDGKPVLYREHSWELVGDTKWGLGGHIAVLTNETGQFMAWYGCGKWDRVAYAESEDGIHWDKRRRMVKKDMNGFTMHYDPHDPRPKHRYKMTYESNMTQLHFAHSADGLGWKDYRTTFTNTVRTDCSNTIMYDESLGYYRLWTRRDNRLGERIKARSPMQIALHFMHKKTLDQWEFVHLVNPPTAHQIYEMYVYKYHDIYITHINLFQKTRHRFCIAVSRDGVDWDWSWVDPAQPIIERGNGDAFDSKSIFPPLSPPIQVGDKLWMFYSGRSKGRKEPHPPRGSDEPDLYSIGLAEIRLDGLIFLQGTMPTGFIETKRFQLKGGRLEVNCDPNGGHLRVSVLDEAGQPIPGFGFEEAIPVEDDGVHLPVTWQGGQSLDHLAGREIKLRFDIEGPVKLYAFQVLD